MGELGSNTGVCIVVEVFPTICRRHRHHQMAAAEAQIQQLVNILSGFFKHVLADDSDIGRSVLHIGRYIGGLRDDEFYFFLLIGDNQLAGVLFQSFSLDTDCLKKTAGETEELALGQRYCQPIIIPDDHLIIPFRKLNYFHSLSR